MDRLAIISDIHGNIPALESVLADVHTRQIKTVICLGDLAGKGPDSALAIDIIKERCDVVIQGNWDDFLPNPTDYPTLKWHQEQCGQERLDYIKNLPFCYDFYLSGKRVRLFHASAKSVHYRVVPSHPLEEKLAMFDNTEATGLFKNEKVKPDIVGYGDIHAAYLEHPMLNTLFNVGSVGNPLDIPEASYVIMNGTLGSKIASPYSIEFVRIPYDIEASIKRARDARMPDVEPYIKELRTAEYRGRQE
ncbi:metallophosphoesterase family protein [Camelliibacillus cellulosilyticus]|uniref:Metallophosphoesterase family protein n=1 Tax=Camelliibacillus cellulosilyticus TaxID=2174486 RepID=A0ABV9GH43_9BACL